MPNFPQELPKGSTSPSPSVSPARTRYRSAEIYLFDTCTMKCGYCWLAESGRVADAAQLAPFRDLNRIKQLAAFFNTRTTPENAWTLLLSGGEPLLMPNMGSFCTDLFRHGNKVALYTSLFVGDNQANFRFLCEANPSDVDYIMASFHPEAEANERIWLSKLELLKRAGHRVFLRFVGHPGRMHRLEELSVKCQELDVAFYPTTLLSNRYPSAYSDEQRDRLSSHFGSVSQFIQLAGGLDTRSLRCFAGSKNISINFQTGNITPCISVSSPSLGNIYEDRLSLYDAPITCPEPGINCICDVHFQQDIVIGAFDGEGFNELKKGFSPPKRADSKIEAMKNRGLHLYGADKAGIGGVQDDSRMFYSIQEVKQSLKRMGTLGPSHRAFRVTGKAPPLFRLGDASPSGSAIISGKRPLRIETPPERWAYAALFPIQAPVARDGQATFVVKLEHSIESGKFGIGCVTADQRAYVGEGEKVVTEADSESNITVDLADGAGWLVIRNVSAAGEPSILCLHNIHTFTAEAVAGINI